MTEHLTAADFVNINGERVDTTRRVKLERKTSGAPTEFHKGYAVEGVPPGTLEEAKRVHEIARRRAIENASKRVPDEWTDAAWLAKAKTKRVRSKPYELYQAAAECKALAEKAGWLRVEVRALSKGGSA